MLILTRSRPLLPLSSAIDPSVFKRTPKVTEDSSSFFSAMLGKLPLFFPSEIGFTNLRLHLYFTVVTVNGDLLLSRDPLNRDPTVF